MATEKERIEKIMESEELNATQFAAEIDITGPTLSHILNGRNNPSLIVLKKILNRYPEISSDWLICGEGPMYRETAQAQTLSLFDDNNEIVSKPISYPQKNVEKPVMGKTAKEEKVEEIPVETEKVTIQPQKTSKSIKKIIVYFDDNTFQEFEGK